MKESPNPMSAHLTFRLNFAKILNCIFHILDLILFLKSYRVCVPQILFKFEQQRWYFHMKRQWCSDVAKTKGPPCLHTHSLYTQFGGRYSEISNNLVSSPPNRNRHSEIIVTFHVTLLASFLSFLSQKYEYLPKKWNENSCMQFVHQTNSSY